MVFKATSLNNLMTGFGLYNLRYQSDPAYTIRYNSNIRDENGELISTVGDMGDISGWDVSDVHDFSNLFFGKNITGLDLSNWDVSGATNMQKMFMSCDFDTDLSNWDVSNVENFNEMFRSSTFSTLPYFSDVSSATTMAEMFHGVDFSDVTFPSDNTWTWNTSNVSNFGSMFESTQWPSSLSFSLTLDWDVSNANSMEEMFTNGIFFNCDITGWNVSNVVNFKRMLQSGGYAVFNKDISGWDVSNAEDMSYMFYNLYSFNQDLSGWNTIKVTDYTEMFTYTPMTTRLGANGFHYTHTPTALQFTPQVSQLIGIKGDLNDDQTFSISDVVWMASYLAGINGYEIPTSSSLTALFYEKGNVNGDENGDITVADLVYMASTLAGIEGFSVEGNVAVDA